MKHYHQVFLLMLVGFICLADSVMAIDYYFDSANAAVTGTNTNTQCHGTIFQVNQAVNLTGVMRYAGSTQSDWYIMNGSIKETPCATNITKQGKFSADVATISGGQVLNPGQNYTFALGNGTSQTQKYAAAGAYPQTGNTTIVTYRNNFDGAAYSTYFQDAFGLRFETFYVVSYNATIILNTYRLFLNTSIANFSAVSGVSSNTSVNGTVRMTASNGTNTITVSVPGNISKTVDCVVPTPNSVVYCNATGIYDDLFQFNATFVGVQVLNFSLDIGNTTLGDLNVSTTNGTITVPLLQGYSYNVFMNAPGYSLDNKSLSANSSYNNYTFILRQANIFEIRFYNETTNTLLSNVNISAQILSDSFSANYSTTNGTLFVNLQMPDDYTIRYWMDLEVPRDYYVTLTNQSYHNLTLYIVDTAISSNYLAVVNSENTRPVSEVTVHLLRGFIENNQYTYRVVQMATTDTNGQAVLRVVPNTIYYKLLLSRGSYSTTTTPTQFTASTNSYTLSFTQNFLTSVVTMPNVQTNFVFLNSTNTYVFTWTDTQNIVTQGCMYVTRNNNTGTTRVSSQCSTGSTGSLTYAVTAENSTSYVATARISTNTEYSTYTFGPISVNFSNSTTIFGLTGILLTLLLVITVALIAQGSGTDTMLITTIVALFACGLIGFVGYAWESFVGFAIIATIIILRSNR